MNSQKLKKGILIPVILSFIGYLISLLVILPVSRLSESFTHNHPSEHTQCKEDDPCHRKIFHSDLINGCQHHSHYSAPIQSCNICDLFIKCDLLYFIQGHSSGNYSFKIADNNSYADYHPAVDLFFKKGRGPPSA
ncbi:MAG: hypothetical protein IPM34_07550 [Saprospiraceae bacterium]|nr:hypothetical protein [Saprospiraceae bacterium]